MSTNPQRIADELRTYTALDWQRLREVCRDEDFSSLAGFARLEAAFDGNLIDDLHANVATLENENGNLRASVAELKRASNATRWWEAYAFKNKPLIKIGGELDPYMIRWAIVDGKGEGNNVYLHKFLRDDEDRALHDHPWDSVSILLSGRLREIDAANPEGKIVKAGDIRHRAADYAHRLVVEEKGFSLFITGPKVREWGFLCAEGWRHWTRFADGEAGELVGIGCGDFSDPATEATPLAEAISAKRLAMGRGVK